MSDLKGLLRRWKAHGTSRKSKSQIETQIATGHPQRGDGSVDHHRKGAEGHALQVNNPPQQADGESSDHRQGAEGHALQVNNHPPQEDE